MKLNMTPWSPSPMMLLLLITTSSIRCSAFQQPQLQHRTQLTSRRRQLHTLSRPPTPTHPPTHPHTPFPSPKSNTALPLSLTTLTAPLGSISVLAVVILIHESGHFLAARSMGIRVKQFSVGVGPKVTGFQRRKEDEDGGDVIDFNLRAIPLGGYVEFPENYNSTMQVQMEIEAEKKKARLRELMKENGEDAAAAALRLMKEDGMGGAAVKKRWWKFGGKKDGADADRRVIVQKDGTVTVPPIEFDEDPDLLQNRSPFERAIVLSAGVVFNLILSFTCFFGLLTTEAGLPKAVINEGALIGSVTDGAPSAGFLNRGDVILALNGQSLSTTKSPSALASQQAISKFITNIKSTTPGESLTLSVLQPSSPNPRDITIQPRQLPNSPDSPPSLGITLGPNLTGFNAVRASSLPDAISKSAHEVTELSYEVARSTLKSIGGLLTPSSSASSQGISGPIGVLRSGSDVVARNDYRAIVGFVAVLSINLAVINSLPFPTLDGGQLLFVVVEVLSGRKVDQKLQENVNALALLFLLSLSITATVGDVSSLVSGR